jgi:phage terminase large subunit
MEPTPLSPSDFAYKRLGLNPYAWNIEALDAVGDGRRVAVRAANGSGKTTMLVAPLILWFLSKYPKGWIPITSGSFRQVKGQLWPALKRFRPLFPDWKWNDLQLTTPEGGQAVAFSTDDGYRAEGWHPKQSPEIDPVFWVVDEAKNVPEDVFQAIDRCTRAFQLFVSSPGPDSGQFFRCFHSEAHYFYGVRVTSFDCPHIEANTPGKYEQDVERYGKDSPLVRSMHFADFTSLENEVILTAAALAQAQEASLTNLPYAGAKTAFCDFAAGGDENALAVRDGNRVTLVDAWYDHNEVTSVDKFIRLFEQLDLSPGCIFGDNGGLGHTMITMMHDRGWPIHRVNNGDSAHDPHYYNRGSEIWFEGARQVKTLDLHFEGIDKTAFEQLTTRRIKYKIKRGDDKALLYAESKEDMKERGLTSPDRGDAIMGAIACGSNYDPGVITAEAAAQINVPDTPFVRTYHSF